MGHKAGKTADKDFIQKKIRMGLGNI